MKTFDYKYPWTDRQAWFIPDGEEMMKGQFPILDEQIDFVLDAIYHQTPDLQLRTCVQAGGAFGVYPRRLADYFKQVWTFEPLLANLQCMEANIGSIGHPDRLQQQRTIKSRKYGYDITIVPKALWHETADLQMHYSKKVKNSYGAHHVTMKHSVMNESVEGVALDEFEFEAVDLIWLDIEGAEKYALMGAAKTIHKCKPVIVIEEAKHLPQHKELGVRLNSASEWLKMYGYKQFGRTHGDLVFVPA